MHLRTNLCQPLSFSLPQISPFCCLKSPILLFNTPEVVGTSMKKSETFGSFGFRLLDIKGRHIFLQMSSCPFFLEEARRDLGYLEIDRKGNAIYRISCCAAKGRLNHACLPCRFKPIEDLRASSACQHSEHAIVLTERKIDFRRDELKGNCE